MLGGTRFRCLLMKCKLIKIVQTFRMTQNVDKKCLSHLVLRPVRHNLDSRQIAIFPARILREVSREAEVSKALYHKAGTYSREGVRVTGGIYEQLYSAANDFKIRTQTAGTTSAAAWPCGTTDVHSGLRYRVTEGKTSRRVRNIRSDKTPAGNEIHSRNGGQTRTVNKAEVSSQTDTQAHVQRSAFGEPLFQNNVARPEKAEHPARNSCLVHQWACLSLPSLRALQDPVEGGCGYCELHFEQEQTQYLGFVSILIHRP